MDFVPGFTRSLVAAPIQAPSEAQAQQVAISVTSTNETKPVVAALGPGRFVVIYDNGAATVARLVELPARRRVIR